MSEKVSIGILMIIYLVGLLGIGLEIAPEIVKYTPINLILSIIIALAFDKNKISSVVIFSTLVFVLGYGIEVAGVQTGKIFGQYTYGEILGPKLYNTPLMIGVNWVLVCYTAGYSVNAILPKLTILAKAALASCLLVVLDCIIEPVAIEWTMWTWESHGVPLQNYLAWWVIGLIMSFIFFKCFNNSTNNVGVAVFILQLLFFGLLNL